MIPANQLRIGNKVLSIFDQIETVRMILGHEGFKYRTDINDMYKHLIGVEENGNQYNLAEIKPIPLTEEWLLKFDAICQPWGWILNGILIHWSVSRKSYKYWIELGNGKRIELPFVHILQNFFALTGEELTIKS